MGWVNIQGKLVENCAFAVMKHVMPKPGIFQLHCCCRHCGSSRLWKLYSFDDAK